jgi:hypothetical protein
MPLATDSVSLAVITSHCKGMVYGSGIIESPKKAPSTADLLCRFGVIDLRVRSGLDGASAPGGATPRPEPGAGTTRPGTAQWRRLIS